MKPDECLDCRDNEVAASKLGWNGLLDEDPNSHGDPVDWMRREIIQLKAALEEAERLRDSHYADLVRARKQRDEAMDDLRAAQIDASAESGKTGSVRALRKSYDEAVKQLHLLGWTSNESLHI